MDKYSYSAITSLNCHKMIQTSDSTASCSLFTGDFQCQIIENKKKH